MAGVCGGSQLPIVWCVVRPCSSILLTFRLVCYYHACSGVACHACAYACLLTCHTLACLIALQAASMAGSVHLSQGLPTWGVVSRDTVCRPVLGLALTGLCMRRTPLQRHVVVNAGWSLTSLCMAVPSQRQLGVHLKCNSIQFNSIKLNCVLIRVAKLRSWPGCLSLD